MPARDRQKEGGREACEGLDGRVMLDFPSYVFTPRWRSELSLTGDIEAKPENWFTSVFSSRSSFLP
jgi:hypothetical protein